MNGKDALHSTELRRARRAREITLQAIEVMEARFGEKLTLQSIADSVFVSRTSLCTAFKEETGMGVGDYLRTLRIDRAKELLQTTTLPIAEIARATGYTRQSSFAEAFKVTTGITPTEWRAGSRPADPNAN